MIIIPAIKDTTYLRLFRGGGTMNDNVFSDLSHPVRFNLQQVCTIEKAEYIYDIPGKYSLVRMSNEDEYIVKEDDIPQDA